MSNSIDISIDVEEHGGGIDQNELERTVNFVLEKYGVNSGDLSLVIVGDDAIRTLKRDWFGMDVVTDVISFNLGEQSAQSDCTKGMSFDCELVVNLEQAMREACRRGVTWQAELNLYIVHGLLHQLGYDDQSPEDSKRMHTCEDKLLEELGFGRVFDRQ